MLKPIRRYLEAARCLPAVEYPAGRSGPISGAARAELLPLCGRLQPLRPQQARREAGDASGHGVSGAETEVEGQRGQERGGSPVGAEVLGLQHGVAQEAQAENRGNKPQASGGENPQDDA